MLQQQLYETVRKFFRAHCASSCSVCVAVSGGGDSVALLRLLHDLRENLGITKLAVAHVNHRIRGAASDKDAEFVRRLAKETASPFHLLDIDGKHVPKAGVEEWARNRRYAFFAEVRRTYKYTYVATAHTQNDQAETVLLRILRGTGMRGLCGIAPVRNDGVIRPLLDAGRDALHGWLSERNQGFCEDSTNDDTSYARNWVRHRVIPLLARRDMAVVRHLAEVATSAQNAAEILAPIINKWIDDNVVISGPCLFPIKKAGLEDGPVAAEAVVRLLAERGVGVDRKHVEEIFENAERTSGVFLLPGGWKYECARNSVEFSPGGRVRAAGNFRCTIARGKEVFCASANRVLGARIVALKRGEKPSFDDPFTAYVDAARCGGRLVFRNVRKGDRFWPFGGKGYTDCVDFLAKQGRIASERKNSGVVVNGRGDVVWVVGLRTGHPFRVTPETRRALQISCRPRA
jgi:tRNA(Ile)-lysidine synthase